MYGHTDAEGRFFNGAQYHTKLNVKTCSGQCLRIAGVVFMQLTGVSGVDYHFGIVCAIVDIHIIQAECHTSIYLVAEVEREVEIVLLDASPLRTAIVV